MKYNNPILKGFNPDPSICRVGEDFYLVTSSFEYFPGIPVYHSRDLVNWKQIGNCIERPEQLPLEQAKSSGGVWAPTIRYDDGVFYVTATFDGLGNFIVTSINPTGSWSNPVWTDFDGIDPSIYFENGQMYYCANDVGMRDRKDGSEGITLIKMDQKTGKTIGEGKRIWEGTGGGWIESPHLYHIGEYYYILTAEGGTGWGHMITVGRSRDIWGPYESCPDNPILTNRNDTSKQVSCSGHGDLVEDGRGNWWMVHLGTRSVQGMSNLGRETFLVPVHWENNWPIVGFHKKCLLQMEGPLWSDQSKPTKYSMDFAGTGMEPQWLHRRKPVSENYIRDDGSLTLNATEVKLQDATGSHTFIALRQPDIKFEIEADCQVTTYKEGDIAGMAVYLSEKFFCRIGKTKKNGCDYLIVEAKIEELDVELYCRQLKSDIGQLQLKITSDELYYFFYYTIPGKAEILASTLSVRFLSCELAGKCFTGALIGCFAECGRLNRTQTEDMESPCMKVSEVRIYE